MQSDTFNKSDVCNVKPLAVIRNTVNAPVWQGGQVQLLYRSLKSH